MKTQDLMIGDWVRIPAGGFGKIQDIVFLYDSQYAVRIEGLSALYPYVEEVPLTHEILAKNGGKVTGSGDYTMMIEDTDKELKEKRWLIYIGLKYKTISVHCAFPILKEGKEIRKCNSVKLECCGIYFHELQHALRLCGINKEIEL